MKVSIWRTIAVVSVLFGGLSAGASTFVAMTAEDLAAAADTVVQGRVIGVSAQWDEDGRIVVSTSRILVTESVVGNASGVIEVQTPGGEVGDTYVEAAGFPRFEKGQEVILYLKAQNNSSALRVVGHQQGHFEVVTRDDGVTLAVPQVDEGVALIARGGQRVVAPQSKELAQFKSQVRATAAAARPAE